VSGFGFKVTRQVAAPRERTFAVVSDFANAAENVEAITHLEVLTPGPVGVGTRFRETRTMFGRPATEEMTVAHWDPPHSYTLKAESHGARYTTVFSFREKAGGTEVEMDFQAVPITFGAKVMGVLFKFMTKKMVETCGKDLEDLARAVERRG
jgi:hypothetical protein